MLHVYIEVWGTQGVHLSKLAGVTSDVGAAYTLSSECLYGVQSTGQMLIMEVPYLLATFPSPSHTLAHLGSASPQLLL